MANSLSSSVRSVGLTMRGINACGGRPMRARNLPDVERGRLSRLASRMTALWAVPNDTDVESKSKKNEVHIGFIFPGKSQPFSERFYALINHEAFEIFYHTSHQQQLKGFD